VWQVSSADGLVTVVAEAGSDVSLTVRPRDRFENSIGSDDFIFELDMSLSSAGASQDAPPAESPDAWTFTAPAYDLLVSTGWAAVYEVGSLPQLTPPYNNKAHSAFVLYLNTCPSHFDDANPEDLNPFLWGGERETSPRWPCHPGRCMLTQ